MTFDSYSGHRILEIMRKAPNYTDAIYSLLRDAIQSDAGPILDFGAGDGLFAERLIADGYVVHCVESSAENQRKLLNRNQTVFPDISAVSDSSYSFIYAINVLEHVEDLDDCLQQITRKLNSQGILFVFVPALDVLWTSLDDEVGHVQRFTPTSMKSAFLKCDLQISSIRFFDTLGFFAALAVRALERAEKFQYSCKTVGFYDRYLFPISLVGDKMFSNVIGKNLIAIAMRP